MDNSSPTPKGQLLGQVIAGVPVILLLGTWLVLFNGAQWGGLFLMLLSTCLLVLTFLGRSSFFFGFLCGALSASLMAYQPGTVTGMSQAGIACAWLLVACLWTLRSHPQFKLIVSLVLGAVVLALIGFGISGTFVSELFVRVNRAQTLLVLMAAFMAFPLSWIVAHHAANQMLLKQHFRWPTSFVLVALLLFSGVGLASSWTLGEQGKLTPAQELLRAAHLARQLGHQEGLQRVQKIRDATLVQSQWDSAQQMFQDGFWRRWSGIDKMNITPATALTLWGPASKPFQSSVNKMCGQDSLWNELEVAPFTWPMLVRDEARWPCLAQQAHQLKYEGMLEALAEEMAFGNESGRGLPLGGCRLRAMSPFPSDVTAGDTLAYEMHLEPWLPNDTVPLCAAEGQVEVYIWGSKAKDVIPFSWFQNSERQAFRQWELPPYMLPGRYPVMANIRQPPRWTRVRVHGLNGSRKGLFLGWVDVHAQEGMAPHTP